MKTTIKKALALLMVAMMTVGTGMTVMASQWQQNATGWWYQNDDGTWPANGWQWIDGNSDGIAECYYFDGNGYMLSNTTTPDGYTVNADGAWTELGIVRTKAVVNTNPIPSNNADTSSIPSGYNENGLSNIAIDLLEHTRVENAAKYGEINTEEMAQYLIVTYQNCNLMVWYHNSNLNGNPSEVYSYVNSATELFQYAPMTGNANSDKNILRDSGYKAISDGNYTVVEIGKYELQLPGVVKNAKLAITVDNK